MGEILITDGYFAQTGVHPAIKFEGDMRVGEHVIVMTDAMAAQVLSSLLPARAIAITGGEGSIVYDKNENALRPQVYLAMAEPKHKVYVVNPAS